MGHQDWDAQTFSHDICLLKLNGKTKKPLGTLQFSQVSRKETEDLPIVGFGFTGPDSKVPSNALRDVDVRYITPYKCQRYYGDLVDDTSMFCAYAPGKDACQGDSGGPIFRRDINGNLIQIGIISWGYQCAVYPGVYTDLSDESISNFIHKIVCGKFNADSCTNKKLGNIL